MELLLVHEERVGAGGRLEPHETRRPRVDREPARVDARERITVGLEQEVAGHEHRVGLERSDLQARVRATVGDDRARARLEERAGWQLGIHLQQRLDTG